MNILLFHLIHIGLFQGFRGLKIAISNSHSDRVVREVNR